MFEVVPVDLPTHEGVVVLVRLQEYVVLNLFFHLVVAHLSSRLA